MVRKTFLCVPIFLILSQLASVASSSGWELFPIIPGAKERPCGESEEGICREMPALRLEIRSAKKIESLVEELLLLSRKKGWKMVRVSGAPEPRYQSTNGKKFDLLWAVEKAGRNRDLKGREETVYHIFYWKVLGE